MIENPKRHLILILLFLFLAGTGFAGMAILSTDNNNGKKLQGPYRQLPGMQPLSQCPAAPAPLQAQQTPVQNAEGKKQGAERAVHHADDTMQKVDDLTRNPRRATHNLEERDVFKEFYLRRVAPVTAFTKGPAMGLDQNLPDMTRLLNANSGAQTLPPVQTLPLNEQPKEVQIYGIACIGVPGLNDDRCAAITSEGVLKKGDKLGIETVFAVKKEFFATSKRTIEFN